jgi:hypothetical protein
MQKHPRLGERHCSRLATLNAETHDTCGCSAAGARISPWQQAPTRPRTRTRSSSPCTTAGVYWETWIVKMAVARSCTLPMSSICGAAHTARGQGTLGWCAELQLPGVTALEVPKSCRGLTPLIAPPSPAHSTAG